MVTADVVRTLLIVDIVGMALLALVFLWQRRMTVLQFCGWGIFALLVPVLGPFMVIAHRPGEWNPDFSFRDEFRRAVSFIQRLLPDVPREKMTRMDRARMRRSLRKQK